MKTENCLLDLLTWTLVKTPTRANLWTYGRSNQNWMDWRMTSTPTIMCNKVKKLNRNCQTSWRDNSHCRKLDCPTKHRNIWYAQPSQQSKNLQFIKLLLHMTAHHINESIPHTIYNNLKLWENLLVTGCGSYLGNNLPLPR